MNLIFYAPDGAGDKLLVAAVMAGARTHGDDVRYIMTGDYRGVLDDFEIAACYGVRASTRIILDAYRRAGKRTLYFDKGYWGRGTYSRVAIDAWQPTAYLHKHSRPIERLSRSGLHLERQRKSDGRKIIYAATTQTWCDFYDLGPARALDEIMIRLLVAQYPGRVVYRPRPAYAKKHPELCGAIAGAMLSDPAMPLADALATCDLLVTLGSNAAVEARAAGVETLVLGDNPVWMLNGNCDESVREDLFARLAWCQWALDEYLSGEAWTDIKQTMMGITA